MLNNAAGEAAPLCACADGPKDHFTYSNGQVYAGTHLHIDLWGAKRLDDLAFIKETLIKAVEACGATLLHIHLHHFTPSGGVSGTTILAESHLNIHSWPERGYAALDAFMCGHADPRKAVPVLKEAFTPERTDVQEFRRGEVVS